MATGTAPDELTKFIQPPGDEAGQLAILLASGNLRVSPKHVLVVAGRLDKFGQLVGCGPGSHRIRLVDLFSSD